MKKICRRFITKKFLNDVQNDKYALAISNKIILDAKIVSLNDALFMDIF